MITPVAVVAQRRRARAARAPASSAFAIVPTYYFVLSSPISLCFSFCSSFPLWSPLSLSQSGVCSSLLVVVSLAPRRGRKRKDTTYLRITVNAALPAIPYHPRSTEFNGIRNETFFVCTLFQYRIWLSESYVSKKYPFRVYLARHF